jgi:hypothetical protein
MAKTIWAPAIKNFPFPEGWEDYHWAIKKLIHEFPLKCIRCKSWDYENNLSVGVFFDDGYHLIIHLKYTYHGPNAKLKPLDYSGGEEKMEYE